MVKFWRWMQNNFDANAMFRHPDIILKDLNEESEKVEAAKYLSYIELDGNIGCLVNGADCDGIWISLNYMWRAC